MQDPNTPLSRFPSHIDPTNNAMIQPMPPEDDQASSASGPDNVSHTNMDKSDVSERGNGQRSY